ncbi:MAG: HDOD domain-containing protein [Deltaproteobacteria bacterium]|nr:HDOD domain-containing protein [Deltaproteobacteria bacterium]
MKKIEEIIKDIERLKPVSYIGDKIMDIVSNPDSSLADLVDIVKYDQGMTANLLRTCNSAYFGLAKEITSVKQAVAFLGLNKVASLVMMGNSAENFREVQEGYDLTEGELWKYSVSSALMSQDLAEKRHLNNVSLIFTAALLKDIGKVILNTYVKDSFEAINKKVQDNGLTFLDAEKEVIGIDHAELGARVAEQWNFSPAMVNIIRNHHHPDKAPADDLSIPIVYVADCICMMMGKGVGSDGLAYRYYQDVVDRLHFSEIDLQKTMVSFREKLEEIEEMVKL